MIIIRGINNVILKVSLKKPDSSHRTISTKNAVYIWRDLRNFQFDVKK